MPVVPITLYGQSFASPFDDQVDPVRTDRPVRGNAIAHLHESPHHLAQTFGVGCLFVLRTCGRERLWISGVENELFSKVALLQINIRIERMDHPELVTRPACRDVEAFLVHGIKRVLAAQWQWTSIFGRIDQ